MIISNYYTSNSKFKYVCKITQINSILLYFLIRDSLLYIYQYTKQLGVFGYQYELEQCIKESKRVAAKKAAVTEFFLYNNPKLKKMRRINLNLCDTISHQKIDEYDMVQDGYIIYDIEMHRETQMIIMLKKKNGFDFLYLTLLEENPRIAAKMLKYRISRDKNILAHENYHPLRKILLRVMTGQLIDQTLEMFKTCHL